MMHIHRKLAAAAAALVRGRFRLRATLMNIYTPTVQCARYVYNLIYGPPKNINCYFRFGFFFLISFFPPRAFDLTRVCVCVCGLMGIAAADTTTTPHNVFTIAVYTLRMCIRSDSVVSCVYMMVYSAIR